MQSIPTGGLKLRQEQFVAETELRREVTELERMRVDTRPVETRMTEGGADQLDLRRR